MCTSYRLRSLSTMLLNPGEDVQEVNQKLIETFIITLMGLGLVCCVGYLQLIGWAGLRAINKMYEDFEKYKDRVDRRINYEKEKSE